MSKKDKCKEFMKQCFGEASANTVDDMGDEDCVAKCRAKISGFLGEDKAKEFDAFVGG